MQSTPALDRTNALELQLEVTGPRNRRELFDVYVAGTGGTGGTLSYAAGRDVVLGNTTWIGEMTDDEIAQLRALLDENGWFDGSLESANDESETEPIFRIDLRWSNNREKYRVYGEHPSIAPVHELLAQMASKRLDSFLDRLPKPDLQKLRKE